MTLSTGRPANKSPEGVSGDAFATDPLRLSIANIGDWMYGEFTLRLAILMRKNYTVSTKKWIKTSSAERIASGSVRAVALASDHIYVTENNVKRLHPIQCGTCVWTLSAIKD
jgi:hypothetical protein